MRTPGRCTNVEGCWISASNRDVWLTVGDDFVCPNCGERLTAPPRQAISFRGLRQAATRSAVVAVGLAAVVVAAIELTPPASTVQSRVVAMLRVPALLLSSDFLGLRTHPAAVTVPQPIMAGRAPDSPQTPGRSSAAQRPPQLARIEAPPAPGSALPVPPRGVLLYAANSDRPPLPVAIAPPAKAPAPVRTPEEDFAAATFITQLSSSTVTPPRSHDRTLVLPISVGAKPLGPETDRPPADRAWHSHGINRRANIILPGPGPDPLAELYDTPSLLR